MKGLDYADQRYYASTYGRFLTTEPQGRANSGDPRTWNQYSYTNGDPVNFKDSRGLYPCIAGYGPDGVPDITDCEDETTVIVPSNATQAAAAAMCLPACLVNLPDYAAAAGSSVPSRAYQQVQKELVAALASAIAALVTHSDCAKDLGQGSNAGGPVYAVEVLENIFNGGIYGSIAPGDIKSPAGQTVSATTTPFVVQALGGTFEQVSIVINDLAGTFVTGSAQDQAVTVLHELGHAMNDIFGPGTSVINDDGPSVPGGTQISMDNTALIKRDCFK